MTVVYALAPIFGLIMLGHWMRRVGFPGESFWPQAEKITYFVFFPAMLTYKLALADVDASVFGDIAIIVVGFLICASLVVVGLQKLIGWSGPVFTSVYQGGVRFNSYVGLAAIATLWDESYLPYAAVMIAIMIPLINVLCVSAFTLSVGRGTVNLPGFIKTLATNPLILGCIAGITLNRLEIGFHPIVDGFIRPLSHLALPLGLLAVGAGLDLKAIRRASEPFFASTIVKLLVFPLITFFLVTVLDSDPVIAKVALLLSMLPTASSSFILARQLGGDHALMAAIISGQTLLSMLTIPLLVSLLT